MFCIFMSVFTQPTECLSFCCCNQLRCRCWCNGCHIKFSSEKNLPAPCGMPVSVIVRSLDLQLNLSGNNLGQVVHTHVPLSPSSIIRYCNGRWCPAAGKVTISLASHWPFVTAFSRFSPSGSRPKEGRWAPLPAYTPPGVWHTLPCFQITLDSLVSLCWRRNCGNVTAGERQLVYHTDHPPVCVC